MKQNRIVIYTDGSSLGNPGPGGYGAVIWFQNEDKVIEIGESSGRSQTSTTNNRMEIMAAIEALLSIKNISGEAVICTDSEYLLNGITKWIFVWVKRGWKTADKKQVLNQDLWQRLLLLVSDRERSDKIIWKKVQGHSGSLGNERADTIATSFALGRGVTFAHGRREEYEKIFGGKLIL